jgi:hypothetical protein
VSRKDEAVTGDQYVFVALASASKAIVSYRVGKRNGENTEAFVADLRERVIGTPEISTDGLHFYESAIRFAFGNRVAYGQIIKTYNRGAAQRRRTAGHGSSRKPTSDLRGSLSDFNELRRAEQLDHSHVEPPLHSIHKRFQQEARKPRSRSRALGRAL